MRINNINSYYMSNTTLNRKNQTPYQQNNITFNGRFLPKGLQWSDLFVSAAISIAAPGLGAGYVAYKLIKGQMDSDNNKD